MLYTYISHYLMIINLFSLSLSLLLARSLGIICCVLYICIDMLFHDDPTRYPFHTADVNNPVDNPHCASEREDPFKAVIMIYDPDNWAPEIQITIDVCISMYNNTTSHDKPMITFKK